MEIICLFGWNGRGLLGAALITKTGWPPVGPGHIAQKSRPIFKDDFLRNVIVSIYFLLFCQNSFVFVFLIRVNHKQREAAKAGYVFVPVLVAGGKVIEDKGKIRHAHGNLTLHKGISDTPGKITLACAYLAP